MMEDFHLSEPDAHVVRVTGRVLTGFRISVKNNGVEVYQELSEQTIRDRNQA